jgi:NTE family protein
MPTVTPKREAAFPPTGISSADEGTIVAAPSVTRTALVLQGGGALGAYQVGVFRAVHEAGYRPDWFAGTSIGAINAAIMAGNAPENRLSRLEAFWDRVAGPLPCCVPDGFSSQSLFKAWSAWQTACFGQPGFFRPRTINPWFASPEAVPGISIYEPDGLLRSLKDLVDLDRINDGSARLSLGAVKVTTGEQVYFDSRTQRLGYEHVMASAALPPAFPPVGVDGEWYWDGGIVSNTPLDVIISDERPRYSTLCFMVDLFSAAGPMPSSILQVEARHKDIVYASRSDRSLAAHRTKHDLRRAVMALWEALPPAKQKDRHLSALAELGCTTTMHIVQLIHQTDPDELPSKDFEFSRSTIQRLKSSGYDDAKNILDEHPWSAPVPPDVGVVIHRAAQGKAHGSSKRCAATRV